MLITRCPYEMNWRFLDMKARHSFLCTVTVDVFSYTLLHLDELVEKHAVAKLDYWSIVFQNSFLYLGILDDRTMRQRIII